MKQTEKYQLAIQLLKDLNCPEVIMNELWLFGMTVHNEEVKLHNWIAGENLVEGTVDKPLLLSNGIKDKL